MILERLDSVQGRLVVLEKGSTSVSSNEENLAEATPVTEGQKRRSSHNAFAVMDEEDFTEDLGEHRTAKRACSLSPHQSDKQSLVRQKEVEDDPSYRQLLASVRNLLDLTTPEKLAEACRSSIQDIWIKRQEKEESCSSNGSTSSRGD